MSRRHLTLLLAIVLLLSVGLGGRAVAVDAADWEIVPSRNANSSINSLADVVAISTDDAWAVGHFFDGARQANRTLIEHWDGTRWRMVPHPDVGTGYRHFSAVDASSATDVWAVGSFIRRRFDTERSLIMRWNGSRWSAVTAPERFGWDAIADVSVVSPTEAWAVGNEYTGSFVTRWDGDAWSIVPSPEAWFSAVHAVASDDVWVVGQTVDSGEGPTYVPLVLHWDGTDWTDIPSPSANADFTLLQSISVLSADDAWAVGSAWDSTEPFHTYIQHWDGSTWSIVPGASVGSDAELTDVVAVSDSEVWAVGTAGGATLIERWNGSVWEVVDSPSPGDDDVLGGISRLPSGEMWAVGLTTQSFNQRTLTLRNLGG